MMSKTRIVIGAASAALVAAAALVMPLEGRRHTPYLDTGGILTVCDGHTGPDIDPGRTYTDPECDALLRQDLAVAEKAVDRAIRTPLPIKTKAAIISFTYNVGGENLRKSTLARLANAGDLQGACRQMSRWVYVKGLHVKGLANRRKSERALCLEGLRE
jgi:lysozyme